MPTYCITAVNRGLGLEYVRQLGKDSSNTIIGTYRSNSSDLADVKAVASSNTHLLVCDTSDEDSIKSFAKEAAKALGGGKKVDFLINNAGANVEPSQLSLSLTAEAVYENVKINVIGPAKVTQYLLEEKTLADNARIVNITSGLGSMVVSLSITPRKCAPYSISKAALNSLTVQQSGELREHLPRCSVTCYDPGWVKTRMGGEGAVLQPHESIGGILESVHGQKDEDNGKFFGHDGKEVPW